MWPYSVCQTEFHLAGEPVSHCGYPVCFFVVSSSLAKKYCSNYTINTVWTSRFPCLAISKISGELDEGRLKKEILIRMLNKFSEILQQMYPSHAAGIKHCLSPTLVELCWFASAKGEFTKVPAGRRLPPLSHRLVRAVVSWSNQLGQIGCLYVFC